MLVTAIDFIWTSHLIPISVRDSSRYTFCFKDISRSSFPKPMIFSSNYYRASSKYLLIIFFAVYQGNGPESLQGYQIKLLLKSSFSNCIKRIFCIIYLLSFWLFFTFIWRLCNDQNGNFTFCSTRGLSVTDYLLKHKFNIDSLNNFQILDLNNFSDHAPIYFTFPRKPTAKQTKSSTGESKHKIVFNEEKIADFKDLLSQNLFSFDVCINSDINIDKKTEVFTNFLYDNANKTFGKHISVTSKETKSSQTSKPKWFDKNCHEAKQEFKTARNIFARNKTNENRLSFVRTRTKYNRIRQKAKRLFKMNEGKRLGSIANSKPRQFW